jgi:dienelactone hydrolase
MALTGERFSAWEAWDGIRGIDYLLSRDDVDPQRIGVTGNSGGGTQTSHITCLDDRISMAAPSCFVTTFLYNLRNELPTDAEQVIPGWIAAGLDMADFFIARIPRPTILIGQEKDFFDVRGLRETYAELKRLYTILGREEDLQLYIGPGGHGFHPDGRRAMYEFFAAVAGTGEALAEPDTPAEPDPLLHAAPGGDILQAAKVTTAGLIAGKALELQKSRQPLTGAALRAAVMRLLALDDYDQSTVPGYKTLTTTPGETGNSWNSSLVKSEAGAVCLLHHRGPAPGSNSGKVSLLIPHESAAVEIPSVPEAAVSGRLFALDTRGTASLYKKIAGDRGDAFFQYYGGDYMYANHGLLLDRPLAGRRTLDILKSIDLLLSQGAEEVTLIGRGTGSVLALFAAFLHPAVKSLIQLSYLESFHSLTQDDRYQWPFSAMVPGILRHFDLPDLYRETALEKNVELVRKMSTREMRIV